MARNAAKFPKNLRLRNRNIIDDRGKTPDNRILTFTDGRVFRGIQK